MGAQEMDVSISMAFPARIQKWHHGICALPLRPQPPSFWNLLKQLQGQRAQGARLGGRLLGGCLDPVGDKLIFPCCLLFLGGKGLSYAVALSPEAENSTSLSLFQFHHGRGGQVDGKIPCVVLLTSALVGNDSWFTLLLSLSKQESMK